MRLHGVRLNVGTTNMELGKSRIDMAAKPIRIPSVQNHLVCGEDRYDYVAPTIEIVVCSPSRPSTWHEINRVPSEKAAEALICGANFAAELPTEKYSIKTNPSGVVTNSKHIHSHISLDMKPNGTVRDEYDDEFRFLERTGKGTSWRQRRNCP